MKEIKLTSSILEIAKLYPDVVDIMAELGFKDILLPGMLQTAGKFMTLQKGSELKKIPLDKIRTAFKNKGYILTE